MERYLYASDSVVNDYMNIKNVNNYDLSMLTHIERFADDNGLNLSRDDMDNYYLSLSDDDSSFNEICEIEC